MWFDEHKCEKGIKALENYKKEWDERHGCWRSHPLHNWASHGCFTSDTRIDCINGFKLISDIVIGDLVKTPFGYKKVLKKFEYESDDLIRIHTTNSHITCTRNHRVFAEKGLIYADALRYDDILFNDSQRDVSICQKYGSLGANENIGFRESFSLAKMKDQLSSMDTCSDGMAFITEVTPIQKLILLLPYIEQFGLSIMVKFQMITISTISMVIPKTMIFQTCNACTKPNIYDSMLKEINGSAVKVINNNLEKIIQKQSLGIKAMKGVNGINNMAENVGSVEKRLKKLVNFVARFIRRLFQIVQDFAAPIVNQKIDTKICQQWRKDFVSFAEINSALENGQSRERVVRSVPLNYKCKQKVYDFEVEEDHCYYANGILVSNSDAMRTLATGLHYITNVRSASEKAHDELESKRDVSGLLPGHFLYSAQDVMKGNNEYLRNRFNPKGGNFD
jgi:hypothetical protein